MTDMLTQVKFYVASELIVPLYKQALTQRVNSSAQNVTALYEGDEV